MDTKGILRIVILAFGLLFFGIYIAFIVQIWQAGSGQPPTFNPVHVGAAAILSGALGSAFAVAMGLEDQRLGPTVSMPSVPALVNAALWAYFLVGLAAIITYLLRPDETPGTIATLALVILGYMAAIFTNAFKSTLGSRS